MNEEQFKKIYTILDTIGFFIIILCAFQFAQVILLFRITNNTN